MQNSIFDRIRIKKQKSAKPVGTEKFRRNLEHNKDISDIDRIRRSLKRIKSFYCKITRSSKNSAACSKKMCHQEIYIKLDQAK